MTNTYESIFYLDTTRLYYIANATDSFDYLDSSQNEKLSIDFSEEILSDNPSIIPLDIEGICVHRTLKCLLEQYIDPNFLNLGVCEVNNQKSEYFHLKVQPSFKLLTNESDIEYIIIEDYTQLDLSRLNSLAVGCIANRENLQELFFSKDLFLAINQNTGLNKDNEVFIELPLYEMNLQNIMANNFAQVDLKWVVNITDSFVSILRYKEIYSILLYLSNLENKQHFRIFEARVNKKKFTFDEKKKLLQLKQTLNRSECPISKM